jgi:phosphoenolpyruvate carboxykinase (ATP)
MPLHPIRYADMLGEKMDKYNTKVWLVNTGWIKGQFGKGHRIPLKYTRALIHDVLDGKMDDIEFRNDNIFNFAVPTKCPGVPSEILNPRDCWADKDDYDKNARKLVKAFNENFAKYKNMANKELLSVFPHFD